jgi:alkyl sulfatase BDS1-like metallo-beta-lactamase superfamily hydrolase
VNIQEQVDQLIDTRPGRELLTPTYDNTAHQINDFTYRSGGTTASYLLLTDSGRIIVNTGMGYEAPHHKRLFDAIRPGPTHHIITTQAHVDHVGGVSLFREPGTTYIAQANNPACQADDARIQKLRMRTAALWFDMTGRDAIRIAGENPGVPMKQDTPTPDIMFDTRLGLTVDGLRIELIASHGETIDSIIVWLPEHRIALISNLIGPLFPHFPNLNTLRGDKYRYAESYLATVRRLRQLQPVMLITGRHHPIVGEELIDASLERLHGAVDYVHRAALDGFNAGTDVATLMHEIQLPPHLRVGQGYGKVAWGLRTMWETYVGWFQLRSTTEMYPDSSGTALADLAQALGPDATLARAEAALQRGDAVLAIRIGEAVHAIAPDQPQLARLMARAHEYLLNHGGDVSFWENGWLEHEIQKWTNTDGTTR